MSKADNIVSKVLAMDQAQLNRFLSSLDNSALEHLEILLDKAEKKAESREVNTKPS